MNHRMMIVAFAALLAVTAAAVVVGSASADSDATAYGSDVQPYAGIEATYAELDDGATYHIVKGGSVSISFAGTEASGMETDLAGSGLITDYTTERIYGTLEKSATVTIGDKTIRLEMSGNSDTSLPVYGATYTDNDTGTWLYAYIGGPFYDNTTITYTSANQLAEYGGNIDISEASIDETYSLSVYLSKTCENSASIWTVTVSGNPSKESEDLQVKCYRTVTWWDGNNLAPTIKRYCDIYHIKILGGFTVKFDAGNGTVVGTDTVEVPYGSTVIFPDATWTGHNFKGWYTQSGNLGENLGQADTELDLGRFSLSEYTGGIIILYAGWEVAKSVSSIEIDQLITIKVGESYTLEAYTEPDDDDVGDRHVTWSVTKGDTLIKKGSPVDLETGGQFTITAESKGTVEIVVRAADGGGASATCTITIVENTVTYAYTLEYDLKGGYGDIPSFSTSYDKTTYDTTVTTLEPTKDGYEFMGWDTNKSATKVDFKGGNKITLNPGTRTLYAVWEKIATEWTLSFDLRGGSGTFEKLTAPEAGSSHSWTLPATEPTCEGMVFSGWARSSTDLTAAYPPGSAYVAYEQDDTIYAIWVEGTSTNRFTLEFDLCGGSGDFGNMEVEVEEDAHVFTIPSSEPTKDGYEFIGWGGNAGASTVIWLPGEKYSFGIGTTTLYAVWKQYAYTLTLYTLNESGSYRTLSGSGFGEVSLTIPADYKPIRTGYTFEGWQTKDGSVTYQPGQTIKISENTALYGKWTKETEETKPMVYFHVTSDDTQSRTVELSSDDLTFPKYDQNGNDPTRSGYVFIGWADVDGASAAVYKEGDSLADELASTKTLHVYAVWKMKETTWTLKLNGNGGSGIADDTLSIDATADMRSVTFTIPAMTLTRSGYTFIGWHEDIGAEPIAKNMMVSASGGKYIASLDKWENRKAVLYAIWKTGETVAEKYVVTFDVGEGKGGPADATSDTAEFEVPTATPTRDGYMFAGWSWKHDGKTETVIPGKTATIILTDKETTLTAIWEEITADTVYEVIFYDSDSRKSLFEAKSFKSSASSPTFTIPSDYKPAKVGYTFRGWSTVPNGTDFDQPGDEIELTSNPTVLYAVWKSSGSGSPTLAWELSLNGSTLTYDASDSENVVSWLWDFGDGTQSSEPSGTHEYAKVGTYTISLKVYSASGFSDSCAKNVVVTEKSNPSADRGVAVYVIIALLVIVVAVVLARSAGVF